MVAELPATPESAPDLPPVAPVAPPGSASIAPAAPAAAVTAPLFGGLRGGRKRKDGLVPGSPEALAADRAKDAERQRRKRERDAAEREPAPLPAAGASSPGVGAPGPVPPAPDSVPLGPDAAGVSFVAWEPKLLEPVFAQLLPAIEQVNVSRITIRASKAGLPAVVVGEIEKDCAWPAPARKALNLAGPALAAKWLNKAGISAENQPEVICGTALAAIFASQALLLKRLDKLIAENKASAPKSETKP